MDAALRFRAGIDLRGARFENTAPVDYRVFVGEDLVVERKVSPHDDSWHPHDVETAALRGELTTIVVEVETKDIRQRRFCFNGWVLDEEQAQSSTRKR